ncbi:MAG: Ig-like domain-containing protein [Oscillospiraceae bacterium]|nr:Ig-like domain-containing protein [Oscillospiraceae bacterium]
MKKILSLLVCACLLCGMMSGVRAADDSDTPQEIDGVYQIGTAEQLLWFAQQVNAGETTLQAELTADIDLTGQSWTPIGTSSTSSPYAGVFDGNDHAITGLSYTGNMYIGLFGYLRGATVRHLTLDVTLTSSNIYAGGLAGYAADSTIEYITVYGSISSTSTSTGGDMGGIVGCLSNCTMTMCVNHAAISGKDAVGGLVGYYSGTNHISYCANTGTVTSRTSAASNTVGGLIGYVGSSANVEYGQISNCYNTGAVSGASYYIGGLLGYIYYNTVEVSNCYNTGTVESTRTDASSPAYVGGFVGYSAKSGTPRMAFNYNAGNVVVADSAAYVGGFGGTLTAVSQSRYNYWLSGTAASGIGNALSLPSGVVSIAQFQAEDRLEDVLRGVSYSTGGTLLISTFVTDADNMNGGLPVLGWQICGEEHSFVEAVVAPTCTQQGYTQHTCEICGYYYTDEETDALGHSYGEGTVTTDPTCYEEGVMTYTCTVCGEEMEEPIATLEHMFDDGMVVAPTCTADGYTVYTCTAEGCGYSYTEDTVPATGHSYVQEITVEATCTTEGTLTYTCTACGDTYSEEIAPLGHSFVDGVCERCGVTQAEACFALAIQVMPSGAAGGASVLITDASGNAVQPDAESGYYTLARDGVYTYTITALNYIDLTGTISGIDASWMPDEAASDGMERYTMTATMQPESNTVTFDSGKTTVTVDGESVTQAEVAYGDDIFFALDAGENRWISDISAVKEAASECQSVWNGSVAMQLSKGSGTESDPYIIETCAQLAYLARTVANGDSYAGEYIRLDANLDLNGLEWTPIGVYGGTAFSGNFDGNGHVIRNLYSVSTDSGAAGGLFSYVVGGDIRNLGVASCQVVSSSWGAGFAGYVSGSTIENCWVTGTVQVGASYTAGLVGMANNKSVISNCWNGAAVSCTSSSSGGVGGVVGYTQGVTVTDCWNVGSVTAGGSRALVGGVVGYMYYSSEVLRCYNAGAVSYTGTYTATNEATTAYAGTGGIAGVAVGFSGYEAIMNDCYNKGAVTSRTGRVGGLVGNLVSRTGASFVELTGSYNTGEVILLDTLIGSAGGLVGRVYSTSSNVMVLKSCYNAGTVFASKGGALVGEVTAASVDGCYALAGSTNNLFYAVVSTDTSESGFYTEEEMRNGEFIIQLGSGMMYTDDLYWVNAGLPVLTWQAARPEVFGEYEQLPILYDEESGLYTIESIVTPVEVRVQARTTVSEKKITFQVEPWSLVQDSIVITVLDAAGTQIQPVSGSKVSFILSVGGSYSYTVQADGFEAAGGTLDITDQSSYLVSIRLDESIPYQTVSFQLNRQQASIYSAQDDTRISGSASVAEGSALSFYILPNTPYAIADVSLEGYGTESDRWDGISLDTSWYSAGLTEYTITTAAELVGVSDLVNGGTTDFSGVSLFLGADLDMSAGNMPSIGYSYSLSPGSRVFSGVFSGQGHTITLAMTSASTSSKSSTRALFGYLVNATVSDVTIAGNVQGYSGISGLAVYATNSDIINCKNLANISASNYNGSAAGLLCYVSGTSSVIDCYNAGTVKGGMGVGGILEGTSSLGSGDVVTIRGCRNDGTITATYACHGTGCGGIMASGGSSGTVIMDACSNHGSIYSAPSWEGGLIASAGSNLVMTNCYNAGNVYCTKPRGDVYGGSNYVGGLCGSASPSMTMQNCYNAGTVAYTDGGSGATGALVGHMGAGTLTNYLNNYWLEGTYSVPLSNSGGIVINYTARQLCSVSAETLKNLYTTLGDESWKRDLSQSNHGFPVLRDVPDLSAASILYNMGGGEYMIPQVGRDLSITVTVAIPVQSVALNAMELELGNGVSYQMEAMVEGEESDLWPVTWSSSDEEVAVVSAQGLVTALACGDVVVTATVGDVSASCAITVTENQYSIIFDGGTDAQGTAPDEMLQYAGTTVTLPENLFSRDGYTFSGWSDGTQVYLAGESYTVPAQDVVLTAVWVYEGGGAGQTLDVYTVSDDIALLWRSGVESGVLTGEDITFTVQAGVGSPVVFAAGAEYIRISADEDGVYTITAGSVSRIEVYYLGDVTMDGVLDDADVSYLMELIVLITAQDEAVQTYADVSGDGKLNALDILLLLNMIEAMQ